MPRLFVAIDLPADIKAQVAQILPVSQPGIRSVEMDQLHLTLHFLGEADLEATTAALRTVKSPPFELSLAGVGQFGSPRRGAILWVGFQESRELSRLHSAIAAALLPTGYQPEQHPYSPHLTVARCKPFAKRTQIDSFLNKHAQFTTNPFPVQEFVLYSSELTSAGPIYHREHVYRLLET